MIQILHRFGLLCFWLGVLAAVACLALAAFVFFAPGIGWLRAFTNFLLGAVASLGAGCAVRFVLGWRTP